MLVNFINLFKKPTQFHSIFSIFCIVPISPIILISFLLLTLGYFLLCSSFSISWKCTVRLFTWDLLFLMLAFIPIHFLLSSIFTTSHKIWYVVFSFFSRYFLNSLCISSVTHWFFKTILFKLRIFVNFPVSSFILCVWKIYLIWFQSSSI